MYYFIYCRSLSIYIYVFYISLCTFVLLVAFFLNFYSDLRKYCLLTIDIKIRKLNCFLFLENLTSGLIGSHKCPKGQYCILNPISYPSKLLVYSFFLAWTPLFMHIIQKIIIAKRRRNSFSPKREGANNNQYFSFVYFGANANCLFRTSHLKRR